MRSRNDAERAIELDPSSAVAYSVLSQAHREQGEHDQALADADKAIELDPDLSLGYAARSYINVVLAEEQQDPSLPTPCSAMPPRRSNWQADEDSYSQMEAHAAYANAYQTRHRHTSDEADFEQAIDLYNQASGGGFQLARHFVALGSLLSAAGRFDEARAAFDRAIERDPALAGAHEALGWLLYRHGEHDAAIDSFTQAIIWAANRHPPMRITAVEPPTTPTPRWKARTRQPS